MTLSFSIQVGANTNTISRIISLAKILWSCSARVGYGPFSISVTKAESNGQTIKAGPKNGQDRVFMEM
ncbi:hypothetical protein [Lysinibacillus sphaericus]|uniref:hypothetical protein n=1 Tax=Lysinibacillus sphaericus TaxID=1421 RepID=UPI001CBBD801|nr:hypothetical protein [Lysinibacillus sphaericus]